MIKRIKEIKNIDAFESINWLAADFEKYNLIYGWNGSGKTTVSRIFGFLEKKEINIPEFQTMECSIQTDTGIVKSQDIITNDLKIKVFNEEFIKENLRFSDSNPRQIVIVGKENIGLKEEIDALEGNRKSESSEYDRLKAELPKKTKHEQILTDAAGEVPKQFGNTPLSSHTYYGRSYKKPRVEDLLSDGTITEEKLDSQIIPDQERISGHMEIIKNEKEEISVILSELENIKPLFESANAALSIRVKVEEIDELTKDKELRDWTEAGYHLYRKRNVDACLFCHNSLREGLIAGLSKYFNDELQIAREVIEDNLEKLDKMEQSRKALDLDSGKLFPDTSKDFLNLKTRFEEDFKEIYDSIKELIKRLNKKRELLQSADELIESVKYPEDRITSFNETVRNLNSLFENHNRRVEHNVDERDKAAKAIELHTISSVLKGREYFSHKKKYEELSDQIKKQKIKVDDLISRIASKRASLCNTALAIEKINLIAKDYFGDGQIYLEASDSLGADNGYVLKRRKKIAKHLSEGEKSVLALIYFFVKLEEEGCDKSECTIIIDDPVDSQDSIFLFRTYGLLKRQLDSARQLIVFTHNFELFNLLRDWLIRKEGGAKLFLIRLNNIDGKMELIIDNIPDLLKDYKTEYQYLFSCLYLYSTDQKELDAPFVANIARKVLEYFACFKWACKSTEEFTSIVISRYVKDPIKIKQGAGDFMVKFLHENSHGQDFTRSIVASTFEAKDIAKRTMEFIRFADKDHFDNLKSKCQA